MDLFDGISELNAGYISELYEKFRINPASVDQATRAYFEQLTRLGKPTRPQAVSAGDLQKAIAAANYINAIRTYGHLNARLDPLGEPPPGDPSLTVEYHHLTAQDLAQLPASIVGGPLAGQSESAAEAVQALLGVYCSSIGYEYGHLRVAEERHWLRQVAEDGQFRPPACPVDDVQLLERLSQVEAFEQFLHRHFPGKTRFSIEGLDMLVPALDEILAESAEAGICLMLIGMGHRGRLNVLAHILQKPYGEILAEFQDPHWNFSGLDQLGWTGDVKYHKGALRKLKSGEETTMVISMAPNPSHLEHINPVIEGMARSAGSKTDHPGPPEFFPLAALPILIHGDASFPGEGITAETLNFSKLAGFETGGTIHIITNNQLGFTATPAEGRSTFYASDLAKGFEIPILHVNADDPTAVLEVIRTAFAYRDKYKKDILVDLIGYRRYGHNEGDEPSFTQPLLYEKITQHPSVRKLLADDLVSRGEIPPEAPDEATKKWMTRLQGVLDTLKPEKYSPGRPVPTPNGTEFPRANKPEPVEKLSELNQALMEFPADFHPHHKLQKPVQRRKTIFEKRDEKTIDWATAEELALASILADGISIRLTGQDVERGTFSQRHAVFHDEEAGKQFIPLQALPQAKAAFEVHNSPLSENAALGFEFGYSVFYPQRLTIWEAQYGDFVNGAQAIIDEFITSAKAKWDQNPSLVMLLPHGYEGQGPDHSSARPERFLQLATVTSLRVANCTTAAQYFHLLRLQSAALSTAPLPLVIFTPKSLLRHPMTASSPADLSEGSWQPVIDDPLVKDRKAIRKIDFCTGKIGVELLVAKEQTHEKGTAVVRVEQLFPFPADDVRALIERYKNLEAVAWVQEEPENMGAWGFVRPRLRKVLSNRWGLEYHGRPFSASPAEGSTAWHTMNQNELIGEALQAAAPIEKENELEKQDL
ncbi:MAG TPA: 2-oxoglutarate dehydrogenase E1 component [Anaerolineaceae bacterium]